MPASAYTGKLINTIWPEPNVAQIQMHDEQGKNCLSGQFVGELMAHIAEVVKSDTTKVIVLSGLPNIFCSGADLDTLQNLGKDRLKPVDILLSKILFDIPVPLISVMEGHAVGGGLALGLCADIAVLAEESRYGCSFMNMGFTPGMGTTKLMEHFMAPAIAHEMLYTGINYKGSDLRGKTNINHILPKKDVLPRGLEIASAIAEKNTQSLLLLKRYLSMQRRKTFEETITVESMMHEITFRQQDTINSIQQNYVR